MILEKRVELRETEAAYQKSPRPDSRACAGGGGRCSADRNTWIGKPVQEGERIMQIADLNDSGAGD